MTLGSGGGGGNSPIRQNASFGKTSNIYVVLDTPKAPMSPAWLTVLNYSCFWAGGEATVDGANQALTETLWASATYNGRRVYAKPFDDSGETFHLKSFLDYHSPPLFGECEDFADFLVCLSTSVGASITKAQRSNVLTGALFVYHSLKKPADLVFSTGSFVYHQFGLVSSAVWDGCLKFQTGGIPVGWDRETTYKTALVTTYIDSPPAPG